jgi:hypothetical protein
MIYQKYVLFIILFCSNLYSQININLIKIIDLPVEITDNEFQPTNLSVSQTGFYFLDSANRQVAFLSYDGDVVYAGGYGIDSDAFIDPIEILSSKLRVWIVDGTENRLIEFDHKLNYLRTIEFDQIYPEFAGVDDWGNILLLSEQEQMILKANPPIDNFNNFIDLSIWNDINNCITNFHVAFDGTIGILSNCNNTIYLFNRLGKLEKIFQVKNIDSKYLIKLLDEWFVLNTDGQITSIRYNEKVYIPVEQKILDVAEIDGNLYILFLDKIWVINVAME